MREDNPFPTESLDDSRPHPSGFSGLTKAAGLGSAQPGEDPFIGTSIGGVTISRVIGEGGMGRVYEGLQDKPHRSVAVKVLRPGLVSREACRRFDNESEVLGKLHHPFIAQIYSAGVCTLIGTKVPYFVMEYVADALPISHYVAKHKLTTEQRLELFRKVCEAVAHGHERGVVHRDLKPSNILVDPSGLPKVIDFGVARNIDASAKQMTALTELGQLIGSVQYMSPEQFAGDPTKIDKRADVYALGVILYELLTGRPPYEIGRKEIFEAAAVVQKQKPVPPSKLNTNIRPDVEKITGRCLHKDQSHRYANAAELAHALGSYLGGQPVEGQPLGISELFQGVWDRTGRWWRRLAMTAACALALGGAWTQFSKSSNWSPQLKVPEADVEFRDYLSDTRSDLKGRGWRVDQRALSRPVKRWLLISAQQKELDIGKDAAEKLGVDLDAAGDFSTVLDRLENYEAVICGANAMDYWGTREELQLPGAFDPVDRYVLQGGHLVIFGTWNGRRMAHLKKYGIQTGVKHAGGFRLVPDVSNVFLAGSEKLVPEGNKCRSAGNFVCTEPHTVLLDRDDELGPAVVTLARDKGRLTFSLVQPFWPRDGSSLWLLQATLAWLANGCPIDGADGNAGGGT